MVSSWSHLSSQYDLGFLYKTSVSPQNCLRHERAQFLNLCPDPLAVCPVTLSTSPVPFWSGWWEPIPNGRTGHWISSWFLSVVLPSASWADVLQSSPERHSRLCSWVVIANIGLVTAHMQLTLFFLLHVLTLFWLLIPQHGEISLWCSEVGSAFSILSKPYCFIIDHFIIDALSRTLEHRTHISARLCR